MCDVWEEEYEERLKLYNDEELAADPEEHRFHIPPGAFWQDVRKHSTNIGEHLNNAFRAIEDANTRLRGVFQDVDFNNKQRFPDATLELLLQHFSQHRLRKCDVEADLLGNAYEYLIAQFASDAGKRGGEFYTPKMVTRLIVECLKPDEGMTIYDPTCGSGGMLLEAVHYLERQGKNAKSLHLYGQEMNLNTWAICQMNLFLHDIDDAFVAHGDTLSDPKHLVAENSKTLKTFQRMTLDEFYALLLPIPPLTEQKKIAEILGSVDKSIASTQAVIDQTRKVKQGLLQQLLTKGIGHTKFKESAIGKIPESWEVVRLGTILNEIVAGKSPNCPQKPANSGEWGVLKVSAIGFGEFFGNENKVLPNNYKVEPKHIVKAGDILISRANTKELVGAICIVPEGSYQLMLCDKTLRLVPNEFCLDPSFLCEFLLGRKARRYFEENATGSSGSMKNISQELIRDLLIPLPSLNERITIINILSSMDLEIKNHKLQLIQLQSIKQGLMQDLLTGKVRVKQT